MAAKKPAKSAKQSAKKPTAKRTTKARRAEPVAEALVEPVVAAEPVAAPPTLHALDAAPVHSKVVVVEQPHGAQTALLATPEGEVPLDANDPAHALPVGAMIRKVAENEYIARHLSHDERPAVTSATAAEAIRAFVTNFPAAR